MRITVYYESGLTEDFDTLNFTASEPFKNEGSKNILSDFQLRFDYLESKGLVLDIFYYDASRNAETSFETIEEMGLQIPVATRRLGWRIQLVSKEELETVVLILRDNEMFAWKQGDEWINAVKFRLQEILCFSSASTDSTNRKATVLFEYLRKAHPTYTEAEVAALMGFSLEAYRAIQEWETDNMDFEEPINMLEELNDSENKEDSNDCNEIFNEENSEDSFADEGEFVLDDEDEIILLDEESDFSDEEANGFEFEDDDK